MLEHIITFSIRRRWLILLLTVAAALSGFWSLTRLPIDAVPDITNVQVQVNAFAPALSPLEIEKQVTFPIEVALSGTPGLESTRSFSRNGFAQITAVFSGPGLFSIVPSLSTRPFTRWRQTSALAPFLSYSCSS
jgi:cobalt-zinc-cadmium resistance protein CzcA